MRRRRKNSFLIFLYILSGTVIFTPPSFGFDNSDVDSLEVALFQAENTQKRINILIELSDLIVSSDSDKALEYANQSLELADQTNNRKSKLLTYLQLGKIYRKKNDYRKSLEMGYVARSLATDLDLDKEYAESLILLAVNFTTLGDFEKSANLNFQALKIFEEIGDKKGIGEAFNQIGFAHFEQENIDKALEYYTQALNIAREMNDLAGISRGLNNVGIVYGAREEYEKVYSFLKESIKINEILNRRLWVGINYSNLGTIYRQEGIFDSSYYYLNEAVQICTELNNQPKLAAAYHGLSLYYFDLEILDSSMYYAKLTYEISRENNIKKMVYNGAKRQRLIYHLQGDFENAYNYSMIENQLKDSLDIENSITRVSQLELLRDFDKLEQENKISQQRREYILILVGAVIVFTLLMLVIIIVNRNRLKSKNEQIERRRLNMELEIRNKELAANVMTLIRKNEILSGIGDKLMHIKNAAVKEETKFAIKKIALELQQTTDNEIWDEFEIRFKQVHGEFYEKLIEQFPDLSPNEHRLCAFLRLNMTTKEISELTGQRIDTLEIARWRLRKKLKITNTKTNLVTFLSEI